MTVLAPAGEVVYRPMTVREPFAYARARRLPLAALVEDAGAALVDGELGWVEADAHRVHTAAGRALPYDALVLAVGARKYERYRHATTIDDARLEEVLRGVVQDVEEGYVRRIAFVMPSDGCWPLPLYELALMTAERARAMCVDLDVTIVTPERAPLGAFGTEASGAVAALLTERGIGVETAAAAEVPAARRVVINPGDRTLEVDRVVALPELHGPSIRGIHGGDRGFIPIDARCRVPGAPDVFAAGDATTFPLKHGGIAALQAEVAARHIAALAGAAVETAPLRPVIHGVLLTGREPLYLTAEMIGGQGIRSQVSHTPQWTPPTKVAAPHLAGYFEAAPPRAA